MQRFSALASEKEAALESLHVTEQKLDTAIKVGLLSTEGIVNSLFAIVSHNFCS